MRLVPVFPVFSLICYCHGIGPSEGYDKEEEEDISGGRQGKGGLERVTWVQMTPLSSTAVSPWTRRHPHCSSLGSSAAAGLTLSLPTTGCRLQGTWAQLLSPVQLFVNPWTEDSSVHGISHARILEWVAISSSKGSSQLIDHTCISCIAGGFFTINSTWEALCRVQKAPKWQKKKICFGELHFKTIECAKKLSLVLVNFWVIGPQLLMKK